MCDAKNLFDEATRPGFSRSPYFQILKVLVLKLFYVGKKSAFDEVLPSTDVMILHKDVVVDVK